MIMTLLADFYKKEVRVVRKPLARRAPQPESSVLTDGSWLLAPGKGLSNCFQLLFGALYNPVALRATQMSCLFIFLLFVLYRDGEVQFTARAVLVKVRYFIIR